MGLAPLLAVIAFAVIPAIAQAAPEWEHCSKTAESGTFKEIKFKTNQCNEKVAAGEWGWRIIPTTTATSQTKEQIKSHGVLTLAVGGVAEIRCQAQDHGVIWNEGGVGKDEVSEFVNENCVTVSGTCATPKITANIKPPWQSELIEPVKGTVEDEIKGISITVECGGSPIGFTGNLHPIASTGMLEFVEASGKLEGPKGSGLSGTVKGKDANEQSNGAAVRPS